ncbi:hypothetical protein [Aeromicrobium sp. Root495]|nr:hypothetical protein [Aeromicrobium sp. Root495]
MIEVEDLGWEAALVDIEGETILLLDALATDEQRTDAMLKVMSDTF